MRKFRSHRGMVLIFALWVLGILTILAVSMAAGIRQKITLVARLDERSRMNYLLQSAVKKTAAYIHQQLEASSLMFTPAVKLNLLNNTGALANVFLGQDNAGIGYMLRKGESLRWGVVDEESKLNLNKTNTATLTVLLTKVLALKDEQTAKLARALLDWRQYGESEITGFFSDEYYSQLQHPYPKKSAPYETLDELLLVKGVDQQTFETLISFVTIYGDGAVNINTASAPVLEALGLAEAVVEKILLVRRGRDGVDATADDYVFSRTFEITADLNTVVRLTLEEARAIDALNMKGLLSTNSFYFTIEATGQLASRSVTNLARAVFSAREDKIVYWNEQ